MYIPFGEEIPDRYAIDNPLISHSLSDLWGVDEGLELYGELGKFCYALAVQNGGLSGTQDFDSDKSVAGRIGFDPTPWLHLSVSGMRTGDLDVQGDSLSAMWFGNGFFRSLGSPNTTKFHANLVEGDVEVRLPHGHLKAFGGYIHYGDNDPAGEQSARRLLLLRRGHSRPHRTNSTAVSASARSSPTRAFPSWATADFDNYCSVRSRRSIWRLSLGLGYRLSPNLVLKAEYSFEQGKELSGASANHEDLFALEAAFKF